MELARDDAELALYNSIDDDRYRADRQAFGRMLAQELPHYRLMKPEEVPEWVHVPIVSLS